MATIDKRPLKAYVRFDGTGRIVPSSLILRRKKPKVGKWVEIPAYECCNPTTTTSTTTVSLALRMLFSNIEEVDAIVGDVTDVANWNTFFDLPTEGTPFTSVSVTGDEVKLYGGSSIKVKPALLYNEEDLLIELDDQAGCITSVGGDAFAYNYSLTTVNLPECTILYGPDDSPQNDSGAFGGCTNLINLNIPLLEEAGAYAFSELTSLTSFNLPLLTTIGSNCFYSCSSLTTLSLPSVTVTGSFPFIDCSSLTTISLPSLTILTNGIFQQCTALVSIDDIDCPALVNPTSLPNSCFSKCSSLTEVNIPSLITIETSCFYECTSLTSVNLPQLITTGTSSFSACSALTTISLPLATTIGESSFTDAVALTTISLPSCTDLGGSVLNNDVFFQITGNTITLTVPSALMTADAGNPDGDIVYLQANNTVTVITV